MGQLAGILGVPGGTGGTPSEFWGVLKQISQISLTTWRTRLQAEMAE